MKQFFALILASLICLLTSCQSTHEPSVRKDLTIFVHIPYSNLTAATDADLAEIDRAILDNNGMKKVTVLYLRPKTNYVDVMQLHKKEYKDGAVTDVMLREYKFKDVNYTTVEGLQTILQDVKSLSKTKRYGMVISSHGDGWIPAGTVYAPARISSSEEPVICPSFGNGSNARFNADFVTLAQALENMSERWEFLLIDACYCQNIEVLYDLRNAFHYVIGSTTEMAYDGQDFTHELPHLVMREWDALCQAYYNSTAVGEWNSTTLSVVDCWQLDQLAATVKQIHASGNMQAYDVMDVQTLDGYDYGYGYNVFFDLSDYFHHCCSNTQLLAQFDAQVQQLVLAERHTPRFNSVYFKTGYWREIRTTCGISCSDPVVDINSTLSPQLQRTAWYKATH